MGRVLPGLTTRTGAISVADAVGTTKDQQLQNALRRASAQKAQARVEQSRDRMTPEGMLKFVGQAADTAGKVASTVGGIGGLIGKGLKALEIDPNTPVTQAMRKAAMAKATRETGGADKIAANIRSAFGQGPVADETVTMLQRMSQSSDANERIAAQQLLPEVKERAQKFAADQSRRSLEQRAGALGYTPESLQAALKAGELEAEAAPLERERAVIERAEDPAQDVDPDLLLAARYAVDDEEQRQVSEGARMQKARELAVDAQQEPAPTEIEESLTEITDLSPEDRMTVAVEQFSRTLSPEPQTAQTQLLSAARGATTPQQQELVMKAAETISILPEGTVMGISPFVDPREKFNKELMKQFPTSAQLGQMERAGMASADRRFGVEQRRDAAAETAAIRRETEAGRNVRFKIDRNDKNKKWKLNQNRLISQFERTQKRLDAGLELQRKRLGLAVQRLKDNRQYRGSVVKLRGAANRLQGLSISERRKGRGQNQKVILTSNLGVINGNIKNRLKVAQGALKESQKSYEKAAEAVRKLGIPNPALTPPARKQQQENYDAALKALEERRTREGGLNDLTKAVEDITSQQVDIDKFLVRIVGPKGALDLSDEDLNDLQDIIAGNE
jgi:hypothetical protein